MIHCTLALNQVLGCRRPGGSSLGTVKLWRLLRPEMLCRASPQRRWATSKTTRWAKNDLEHIGRKKQRQGRQGKLKGGIILCSIILLILLYPRRDSPWYHVDSQRHSVKWPKVAVALELQGTPREGAPAGWLEASFWANQRSSGCVQSRRSQEDKQREERTGL